MSLRENKLRMQGPDKKRAYDQLPGSEPTKLQARSSIFIGCSDTPCRVDPSSTVLSNGGLDVWLAVLRWRFKSHCWEQLLPHRILGRAEGAEPLYTEGSVEAG